MLSDAVLNPFDMDPRHELMHSAVPVQNWTEYVYFFGYCLESRHGVSVHIGKEPTDPSIWRGTVGIFLEDGDLLVAKYHGRDGTPRSAGSGPLRATCVEPMRTWAVEFDGLAHRISRSGIMKEVHADSLAEVASFHLVFESRAPVWDLEKGAEVPMILIEDRDEKTQEYDAKTHHWEQICAVRGEVRYGGKTYTIAGGGVRDHTFGPRDYWPLVANLWINAVFPSGKAIMLMSTRVAGYHFKLGYIYGGDNTPLEVVKLLDYPFLTDADTPPRSVAADPLEEGAERKFRFVFQSRKGREVIEGEMLHSMGTTYVSPNHELLGTDLSRSKDGSQLAENPARFVWDGEVGVGVRERIVRCAALR